MEKVNLYNLLCALRPTPLQRQPIKLDQEELKSVYKTYNDIILEYNDSLKCYIPKVGKTGGDNVSKKIIVI